MKQLTSLALFSYLPGLALAHGEHGGNLAEGLLHMVSDGVHLWPWLLLALLLSILKRPVLRLFERMGRRRD